MSAVVESDLVLVPEVRNMACDSFGCGPALIEAGASGAMEALPAIQNWFAPEGQTFSPVNCFTPGSEPA